MDTLHRLVGIVKGKMLRKPLGLCDIGDLDGMVCAALFKMRYPDGVVVFASPKDVQKSFLIRHVGWDFVGDLPCPGKVRVRADHHATNKPCAEREFYDPDAPAAAVMCLKAFDLEEDEKASSLVELAVETDTANIKTREAEVLNAATKGATYREKLVLAEKLAKEGKAAADDPFVKKLAERYFVVQRRTEEFAEKITPMRVTVVVFKKNSQLSYRYLCILLERRGAEVTFLAVPRGLFTIRVYLGARQDTKYDVSLIASALGGGGHRYAAGAHVTGIPRSRALNRALRTLTEYLGMEKLEAYLVDEKLEVTKRIVTIPLST